MKLLVVLIVFFIGISLLPVSFSQEIIQANQESIEVTISKGGHVSVMHEIKKDPFRIVTLQTLEGTILELKLSYENGDDVEYTFDNNIISINQPGQKVIVEYNLEDALVEKNGYWRWVLNYPNTIKINFPQGIEQIFANDRPVILDGSPLNCHGCGAKIEYLFDEPKIFQNVSWDTKEFDVEIRTLSNISSFIFDQPSKRISFDVEAGKFVTVIIPLELLWEPYEVYLDDKKILNHEFFNDGTNAWVNFRPSSSGTIDIIGTSVVPEFPILIPLVVGMTIILAIQFRSKVTLR